MQKLNTTQEVYDLLTSAAASAALGAAIETGLLWLLAAKPLDASGVAQAMKIPDKRCRYWLQFLQALGVLDQNQLGYLPSPVVRAALLEKRSEASWKHLVLDERERAAGVHNLGLFLDAPGSIWKAQGLDEPLNYVEKMRRDDTRAREFTRMLFEIHQYLGEELAALLDLSGVQRLLDIGGNSGVVSMALLRKYPGLTSTVVDIENVCIAGREIAVETSWSDRIEYLAADVFQDDFPNGYDLAMLCDVPFFGVDFFQKVRGSLNPGGRVVLVFHFALEKDVPPPKRLEWTFLDSLADPDLTCVTLDQARDELSQAGFHVLPGEHILSDQRIVLEAYC